MKFRSELSDDATLQELGRRIARLRLERDLTQRQLAEDAGVDRKGVLRLEAGDPVQIVTLVRVLRALGRLHALDSLLPEAGPSPMELLQLHGRERQRASGRAASESSERRPWRWGDET
jgi:transcriptional regulator with XRE-family HTH domain